MAYTNGDDAHVDVQLARPRVAAAGGFEWHQFALPTGWAPGASELNDAETWGDGRSNSCSSRPSCGASGSAGAALGRS